jgi:hypothetical protein
MGWDSLLAMPSEPQDSLPLLALPGSQGEDEITQEPSAQRMSPVQTTVLDFLNHYASKVTDFDATNV